MRFSIVLLLATLVSAPLRAQTPAPAEPGSEETKAAAAAPAAQPSGPLAQLAWLEGCWRGSVNRREFREHWLPLRGDLMVGVSHTVTDGKTQDYEYLRLEPRADGVWYVALQSGQPETAFKLGDVSTDKEDQIFRFDNPQGAFPQHVRYRRGSEGWMYAEVDGAVNGTERKVVYPMRRIDCQSGELIRK